MAKKNEKSTAIAKAEPQAKGELISAENFALIADKEGLEALIYNLKDESLSEFDLDRVKVPSGGATVFQIPGLDGISNAESIEGIILHIGIRRAFWRDPNPSGKPPECFSTNGLVGIGDPGGDCGSCPFNQYGSALKADGSQGRGKRCRESRMLLLVRPEDRLPIVISAPPASIKGMKQWLMRLPVFMFQAVVRLSLEPEKSGDGIKFSKLVPEYVGRISLEEARALQRYAETLKKILQGKAPIGGGGYEGEEETPIDPVAPPNDGNTIDGTASSASANTPGGADILPDDPKE